MKEWREGGRPLPGAEATRAELADEEALEYWIQRAERLNTAKLRVLTDHFRRDVIAVSETGLVRIG